MVSISTAPRSNPEVLDAALRIWVEAHAVKPVLTDHIRANELWNANCGPMSLAAILNFHTVEAVRPLIEPFRGYMSPSEMLVALQRANVQVEAKKILQRRTPLPRHGLVRIQWKGPWCDNGVNPKAAYRYTHWIAVRRPSPEETSYLGLGSRELLVYDAMPNRWVPMSIWSAWCPSLWPNGTIDWYVASCFDLHTESPQP
jgi:hypothetical protein